MGAEQMEKVLKLHTELENNLLETIMKFELDTGTHVDGITLTTAPAWGSGKPGVRKVHVGVNLLRAKWWDPKS